MLSMQVVLRVRGDPASAMSAGRAALYSLDPDLPLGKVSTLAALVDHFMMEPRFSMLLVSAFGVLAVVLTSIGMYGMVSYSVAQRTRQIGIRMALGAERHDVFTMVVGQGARLAFLGITLGSGGRVGDHEADPKRALWRAGH
jgi:putative ABC transport system permease protein